MENKWNARRERMTVEEMKELKLELGITNEQLASASGVSYSTVTKILTGVTKRSSREKLKAIENSLREFLKDETAALRLPVFDTRKTIDDYYSIPEDCRMELIDGILYDMNAPMIWHQRVAGLIHFELLSYVRKKGGKCLPLIAPVDVQLDRDKYTMIQPDVIILCDPRKLKKSKVYGAPDWVLEVASKSSKQRDYFIKLNKYREAGVKEYWIIDHGKITVYSNMNTDDFEIKQYTFEDKIPVGIYDDLVIDMACLIDFEDVPES